MKLSLILVSVIYTLNACYGKDEKAIDNFGTSLRKFTGSLMAKLDEKLSNNKTHGNIFYSPNSIAHTLGIVMAGAGGKTEEQIRQVLMIDSDKDYSKFNINNLFKKTFNKLFNVSRIEDIESLMANVLFLQEDFSVNAEYIKNVSKFYDTELQWTDFSQSHVAANIINSWVNHTTRGYVDHIIKPSDLGGLTRMVIANAIYFQSKWKFEMISRGKQTFYGTNGPADVDVIGDPKYTLKYKFKENVHQISIPYMNDAAEFIIMMPDDEKEMKRFSTRNNLISYLRTLPEETERWRTREVNLTMPKFEIEQELDLKVILNQMGVRDLFDQHAADLSGISDTDLYVSSFTHKAKVTVDEKGTTAAAASVMVLMQRSASRIIDLEINKPFFFAIYRKKQIMFFGKLNNI